MNFDIILQLLERVRMFLKNEPSGWVFILITLTLISAVTFGLLSQLMLTPCSQRGSSEWILACDYQEIIIPVLVIILLVTMLPVFLYSLISEAPSPVIVILILLYWLLISLCLQRLYYRIKKIPKDEFYGKEKEEVLLMVDLGFFMIFCFFLITIFNSLFYYPKNLIEIKFEYYILVASLLVVITTFFYTSYKNKISRKNDLSIKSITAASLLFLLAGSFITFNIGSSITKESEVLDLAILSALQSGFFITGFYGVLITFLIITMILMPKRKKKTIIDYDEANGFF